MYKITLSCTGIPEAVGVEAASEVTEEFSHRPWHRSVRCSWDGARLLLLAENDYDVDGLALSDEFSDAIAACVVGDFGYSINIESVSVIETP